MKKGKKVTRNLEERVAAWESIPGSLAAPGTKVANSDGMHYHKPGSQNLRKGGGKRRSAR